ncbi:unnamed protein product [Ambrosiozyma monospora]|uniref:Unnamed protein product n=1 Tax=Ambrosiozyma monospora TaxID=43982 RepID=A0A9W6YRZ7_AMBMO|nr:unnamed protein product [Ambrosiozyma monospora]
MSLAQKQLSLTSSELNNPPPKVIDINTLESKPQNQTNVNDQSLPQKTKKTGFSFWSFFYSQNSVATNKDAISDKEGKDETTKKSTNLNLVNDSTNEVIAMKKVQEDESTDEFIDIQVRKLSYAEVAALEVQATSANSNKKTKNIQKAVIDQDKELEKSVTDMEFADSYQKTQKYQLAEVTSKVDYDAFIDDEELFSTKPIPKKLSKKLSKHAKSRKRSN